MSLKDLMDLIAPVVVDNEPPILLSEGQTVYKVVRGDVEECIAEGRTWVCGEDNRGYDLDKGMAWNTQIDKVVFTDLEAAKRVAERYLAEHEHVLGKDIRATEVVAYRYMYNGLEIVNFYAVLENGDVYFRYGGMYEHIGSSLITLCSYCIQQHFCRSVCLLFILLMHPTIDSVAFVVVQICVRQFMCQIVIDFLDSLEILRNSHSHPLWVSFKTSI